MISKAPNSAAAVALQSRPSAFNSLFQFSFGGVAFHLQPDQALRGLLQINTRGIPFRGQVAGEIEVVAVLSNFLQRHSARLAFV